MSSPTTNVEKQARRHSPALRGIAVVLGFVAILFAIYLFNVTDADESAPAETSTVQQ